MYHRRFAFTAVELLVSLSIIGFLIALLLPAVQSVRENARKSTCQANLKQLGLGIQQYEELWHVLPRGRIAMYDRRYAGSNPPCTTTLHDKGYIAAILPYLELKNVYDLIDQRVSIFAQENEPVFTKVIPGIGCPSDPGAVTRPLIANQFVPMCPDPATGPFEICRTSYRACAGFFPILSMHGRYADCKIPLPVQMQLSGCMNDLPPIPLAGIRDGLGHTMLLSELATEQLRDLSYMEGDIYKEDALWFGGDHSDTTFSSAYPPNSFRKLALGAVIARRFGASSYHPNGLNALFCDGSVRFMKDDIDCWQVNGFTGEPVGSSPHLLGHRLNLPPAGVWQALCTRDGRERNLTQLDF